MLGEHLLQQLREMVEEQLGLGRDLDLASSHAHARALRRAHLQQRANAARVCACAWGLPATSYAHMYKQHCAVLTCSSEPMPRSAPTGSPTSLLSPPSPPPTAPPPSAAPPSPPAGCCGAVAAHPLHPLPPLPWTRWAAALVCPGEEASEAAGGEV